MVIISYSNHTLCKKINFTRRWYQFQVSTTLTKSLQGSSTTNSKIWYHCNISGQEDRFDLTRNISIRFEHVNILIFSVGNKTCQRETLLKLLQVSETVGASSKTYWRFPLKYSCVTTESQQYLNKSKYFQGGTRLLLWQIALGFQVLPLYLQAFGI